MATLQRISAPTDAACLQDFVCCILYVIANIPERKYREWLLDLNSKFLNTEKKKSIQSAYWDENPF